MPLSENLTIACDNYLLLIEQHQRALADIKDDDLKRASYPRVLKTILDLLETVIGQNLTYRRLLESTMIFIETRQKRLWETISEAAGREHGVYELSILRYTPSQDFFRVFSGEFHFPYRGVTFQGVTHSFEIYGQSTEASIPSIEVRFPKPPIIHIPKNYNNSIGIEKSKDFSALITTQTYSLFGAKLPNQPTPLFFPHRYHLQPWPHPSVKVWVKENNLPGCLALNLRHLSYSCSLI